MIGFIQPLTFPSFGCDLTLKKAYIGEAVEQLLVNGQLH